MDHHPDLARVLRQLVNGEFEADEWIEWWSRKSDWVATLINRGQWLRLKPPRPDGFGPSSRCACVSQLEARALLDQWGLEYTPSDCYQQEWEAYFEENCAQEQLNLKERQRRFRPVLKELEVDFPRFVRFLRRDFGRIESMDAGASDEEIASCESSLNVVLPSAYKRFVTCCRSIEIGDILKLGLPFTFVHESSTGTRLPTHGLLGFGECWLEGDGDQVLFGAADEDPPVLYYAHDVPELRHVARSFVEWIEAIPDWDSWQV